MPRQRVKCFVDCVMKNSRAQQQSLAGVSLFYMVQLFLLVSLFFFAFHPIADANELKKRNAFLLFSMHRVICRHTQR